MFSKAPDSAARSLIYTALFWLAIGVVFLLVAAAKLAVPDFLSTRLAGYGRMRAAGSISFMYGWLTLGGLAAIVWIVPRLTGKRLRSELPPQVAGLLINIAVTLGVALSLFGGVQDHEFSELPAYLDIVLVLAFSIVGTSVGRAISRRIEPRIYVSLYYFLGGLIWAPLTILAGNFQGLPGLGDSMAHLFELNAFFDLWLVPVGIGALYYVVPRASGGALYSHRLAVIGFWSLAVSAPLAGQARLVFGPAEDRLETIAIAAAIALLVPVLTVLVNLFGTLRGTWARVPDHPSIRFFIAGTLFFSAASLQFLFQSIRSAARDVGATEWITGQIWLLLLGAATAWTAGLIAFALPRLIGHRWVDPRSLTASFWMSVLGAGGVAAGALGSGIVTAAVLVSGVANQNPLSTYGYDVVLDGAAPFKAFALLGWILFAVSQWLFVINVVRTTAEGDPHPIEIVVEGTAA